MYSMIQIFIPQFTLACILGSKTRGTNNPLRISLISNRTVGLVFLQADYHDAKCWVGKQVESSWMQDEMQHSVYTSACQTMKKWNEVSSL